MIQRRTDFLMAYQNPAYAAGYAAFVDRVAPRGTDRCRALPR